MQPRQALTCGWRQVWSRGAVGSPVALDSIEWAQDGGVVPSEGRGSRKNKTQYAAQPGIQGSREDSSQAGIQRGGSVAEDVPRDTILPLPRALDLILGAGLGSRGGQQRSRDKEGISDGLSCHHRAGQSWGPSWRCGWGRGPWCCRRAG